MSSLLTLFSAGIRTGTTADRLLDRGNVDNIVLIGLVGGKYDSR